MNQHKPSLLQSIKVKKSYLVLFSGLVWTGVGIMLNTHAFKWLASYNGKYTFVFALVGVVIALLAHHLGFLRIVDKNLGRIKEMENDKASPFAFMPVKSYFMVILMIGMGIILRNYSPIAKEHLAMVYIAMGGALFLSSIRYYRILIQCIRDKHDCISHKDAKKSITEL